MAGNDVHGQPVVAVRFCPVLFELRAPHASDNPAFQLPYRMVFALATLDSITIYDTQVQACTIAFWVLAAIGCWQTVDIWPEPV